MADLELDNGELQRKVTEQPQQNVAEQAEVQRQSSVSTTLTPLQQAQKAYDDAVAKQQEANNAQIKSLQDIIDRFGPAETAEQAQAREAKDRRKRNLMGLLQLGSTIGNMINSTTGGHMGERSVEQPNLVGAYDQARNTELTHRMKRDEKRNAARQAMINLQAQGANAGVNRSFQTLSQAIKGEQLDRQQRAKMDLEKFKTDKAEKENQAKRDWNTWKATLDNKYKYADLAERGRHNKVMEEARARANEISKERLEYDKTRGGGSKGSSIKTIPIAVEGSDKTYNIPDYVLKDSWIIGGLKSCLTPFYAEQLEGDPNIKDSDIKRILAAYALNPMAHTGKYAVTDSEGKKVEVDAAERFNEFKRLLESAEGSRNGVGEVKEGRKLYDILADQDEDEIEEGVWNDGMF